MARRGSAGIGGLALALWLAALPAAAGAAGQPRGTAAASFAASPAAGRSSAASAGAARRAGVGSSGLTAAGPTGAAGSHAPAAVRASASAGEPLQAGAIAGVGWIAARPAPAPGAPAAAPGLAAVPAPATSATPAAPEGLPRPDPNRSGFERSRYTPAVLYLNLARGRNGDPDLLDLVLIPPGGELIGRRVSLRFEDLRSQLRSLYGTLARQEPLRPGDASSPIRQLHRLLIEPVAADLRRLGISTLILVPDTSLQAVPYAALHDGERFFGERMAFSLTPSISLMRRELPAAAGESRQLAFGASRFEGLAPLPLVPQEVNRITESGRSERYLERAFTPERLLSRAGDPDVQRVHVATHAEFLPGGPGRSRLYAGTGSMDLGRFAALRQRRAGDPLDLFVLSACRTALGDPDSELGFAGLALQAGSRSAIGTLWYVDDVATSAFFVQFYRHLDQGMPKAEALQATRRDFASGQVRLQGNRLLGGDGTPLLEALTPQQQRRVAGGLQHPFFWAGIALLGTPW